MHPVGLRRRRLLAAGALALLLPGCSGAPGRRGGLLSSPEIPPGDVLERWRATARLAARTTTGGGNRSGSGGGSWSGTLDWRQERDDFRLRLSGPFGQGALEVAGRPGEVELTTARGERRSARTPEALFLQELGWDLPASSLRHWITARARPGVPVEEWALDEEGRLASLAQQGWLVEYAYRGSSRTRSRRHDLPDRITLRGEGAVVRIAIRDWHVD